MPRIRIQLPAVGMVLAALALSLVWCGPLNAPTGSVSAAEAIQESAALVSRGRQVYAASCATCHGMNGDGNGAAAHMFRVRPRDFRQGIFKFRSTLSGLLPTDDDLLRIVTQGLRWTGMVGRPDLPEADRRAVVQYLKTFSPRFREEPVPISVPVPRPPATSAALVEKGRRAYQDSGCVACHGQRGRGDGPSAPGLKDYWGGATRPSDLTWRPLKRGSSVEDVYLTIATGLSGTPMPHTGGSLDGEQIWSLVYYLDALVPPAHRLAPRQSLGEEARGWMALRMGRMMGGMMGPGRMGPGMMHRMPGMRW